jgi:hypothetical protein
MFSSNFYSQVWNFNPDPYNGLNYGWQTKEDTSGGDEFQAVSQHCAVYDVNRDVAWLWHGQVRFPILGTFPPSFF